MTIDYAMDNEKLVNSLLKPLGIAAVLVKAYCDKWIVVERVRLIDAAFTSGCICKYVDVKDAYDGPGIGIFENYTDLLNEILGTIKTFYTSTKDIGNPYFGCKSLEEAMIRRDLMLDEA